MSKFAREFIVATVKRNRATSRCKHLERFRLRFQLQLREYSARQVSVAEGFGRVWEKTLDEVPLGDEAQAQLYRELIAWARSGELFTSTSTAELFQAWRQTVHEC